MFITACHFYLNLIFVWLPIEWGSVRCSTLVGLRFYPGANVIKLFLSMIHRFLYLARVFVRLCLPMANTSLLRKPIIYRQKSLITLGPGVIFLNCMVNFRVIRVKVVAPEKPLNINSYPKITLMPI